MRSRASESQTGCWQCENNDRSWRTPVQTASIRREAASGAHVQAARMAEGNSRHRRARLRYAGQRRGRSSCCSPSGARVRRRLHPVTRDGVHERRRHRLAQTEMNGATWGAMAVTVTVAMAVAVAAAAGCRRRRGGRRRGLLRGQMRLRVGAHPARKPQLHKWVRAHDGP